MCWRVREGGNGEGLCVCVYIDGYVREQVRVCMCMLKKGEKEEKVYVCVCIVHV